MRDITFTRPGCEAKPAAAYSAPRNLGRRQGSTRDGSDIQPVTFCTVRGEGGHQIWLSSDRLIYVVALEVLVSIWCPKIPQNPVHSSE
jgi:hypothetical protein